MLEEEKHDKTKNRLAARNEIGMSLAGNVRLPNKVTDQ